MKTLTLRLSESDYSAIRHQADINSRSIHSQIVFKLFGPRDIRLTPSVSQTESTPIKPDPRAAAIAAGLSMDDADCIDFDEE